MVASPVALDVRPAQPAVSQEYSSVAYLRAEAFGEVLHATQGGPQVHIAAVQEHTQQGMSGAGVGDQL